MEEKDIKEDLYLEIKNYNEIPVLGDGNCFFRCVSMSIEFTEENHQYYRNLVYNYIKHNQTQLELFFARLDNETDQHYHERYDHFIENIKNDGTYAGDFEISAASLVLGKEIVIYRKSFNGYELHIFKINFLMKLNIYNSN